MTGGRVARTLLAAAVALLLAGCTGLPTTGTVGIGNALDEIPVLPNLDPVALPPGDGDQPEQIVEGFIEAGVTPADDWSTAQSFLTPGMRARWKASAGVTVDSGVLSRTFTTVEEVTDELTQTTVTVKLDQIGSVDENGDYTAGSAPSTLTFELERDEHRQWRISKAPDGIVLDASLFPRVYNSYALQYFDPSWTHLVPDLRWLLRRPANTSNTTAIVREVISGTPSAWLAPGVVSAFPPDIGLAVDAVKVVDQVAEVPLNRAAAALDPTALARMRTQLEASLEPQGVTEVRFTVDGQVLDVAPWNIESTVPEPGTLVLAASGFGMLVGAEVTPLLGLSAQISAIVEPITAIDVAANDSRAAVQLADGAVHLVLAAGDPVELDARAHLIAPALDPYGYTWTVPGSAPQQLWAWDSEVVSHRVARAWPEASGVSHVRIAADGVRLAAVVSLGGQRRVVVAAIIRDAQGMPIELGEAQEVARLEGPAQGLGWLGRDALVVLAGAESPELLTQVIGGPGSRTAAPTDAMALAGGRSAAGVRILGTDGVLYTQRGSWQEEPLAGVKVLGTRAGL